MYGKLKRDWTFYNTAASLEFGQYNLLSIFLTLPFINCSEFIFLENYLLSDSHTNRVNLGLTCRFTQNAMRGAMFFAYRGFCLTFVRHFFCQNINNHMNILDPGAVVFYHVTDGDKGELFSPSVMRKREELWSRECHMKWKHEISYIWTTE